MKQKFRLLLWLHSTCTQQSDGIIPALCPPSVQYGCQYTAAKVKGLRDSTASSVCWAELGPALGLRKIEPLQTGAAMAAAG